MTDFVRLIIGFIALLLGVALSLAGVLTFAFATQTGDGLHAFCGIAVAVAGCTLMDYAD